MLNVQHVSGGYSNEAVLKDISFEVETGRIIWDIRAKWKREDNSVKND